MFGYMSVPLIFPLFSLQGPPGSRGLSGTRGPKGRRVRTNVQLLILQTSRMSCTNRHGNIVY